MNISNNSNNSNISNNKITFYFQSTKNKKYGYSPSADTYNCTVCGKLVKNGETTCTKKGCDSKFVFRV